MQYITTMVHKKKNKAQKIALCSMIIAVLCEEEEEEEMTRREWCKDWLHKRNERGSHATIFQELRTGYESDFTNYMRMDPNTFYDLLEKLKPFITKQDTCILSLYPSALTFHKHGFCRYSSISSRVSFLSQWQLFSLTEVLLAMLTGQLRTNELTDFENPVTK